MIPSTTTKPSGLNRSSLACGCIVHWRRRSDGAIHWGRWESCQRSESAGGFHAGPRSLWQEFVATPGTVQS